MLLTLAEGGAGAMTRLTYLCSMLLMLKQWLLLAALMCGFAHPTHTPQHFHVDEVMAAAGKAGEQISATDPPFQSGT